MRSFPSSSSARATASLARPCATMWPRSSSKAYLVHQRRPVANQPIAHAVQRLHVELLLRFHGDKAHGGPARGFRDGFGIPVVVLLCLDVGPHVFGRHEADLVSLGGQSPADVVGATAGLMATTAWILGAERWYRGAYVGAPGPCQPCPRRRGCTTSAEIDADDGKLHGSSPSSPGLHQHAISYCSGRGGPSIKGADHASEQNRPDVMAAREAWFEGQLDLDPDRIVFIDETAAATNMERRYGRAVRGERCRIAVPLAITRRPQSRPQCAQPRRRRNQRPAFLAYITDARAGLKAR